MIQPIFTIHRVHELSAVGAVARTVYSRVSQLKQKPLRFRLINNILLTSTYQKGILMCVFFLIQVIVSQYTGGTKLTLKGKDLILVEKHTKCKCDCTIKQEVPDIIF